MTQLALAGTALSVFEFSEALLTTEDLDPVYVVLTRAQLPGATLQRWLVAYWWFYHTGVASWIAEAEGSTFYDRAHQCVPRAPRGAERRHFRGLAATTAIDGWSRRFSMPEAVFDVLPAESFAAFAEVAGSLPQCGPWIIYKMADMCERVLRWSIQFPEAPAGWHREPILGATLAASEQQVPPDQLIADMLRHRWPTQAPPHYDRGVGSQEVETMLCKFKAHRHGHYPVGKDWKAVRAALAESQWASAAHARLSEVCG